MEKKYNEIYTADSAVFIPYLRQNFEYDGTRFLVDKLEKDRILLTPIVLLEVTSYPETTYEEAELMESIPLIGIKEGFWQKARDMRKELLKRGLKAKVPDLMIAQFCIDYSVPLITRDKDFRHYEEFGLRIWRKDSASSI